MSSKCRDQKKARSATRCMIAGWVAACCTVPSAFVQAPQKGQGFEQDLEWRLAPNSLVFPELEGSAGKTSDYAAPAALCVALTVAVAGMVSVGTAANAVDESNGQRVFGMACSVCHTEGGNNLNPMKAPRLSHYDVEAIKTQVVNGKGAMPAFGTRLSDKDLDDVANYVIKQNNERAWPILRW